MIVYLHGFLSSPQSTKARLIGQRLAERDSAVQYVCPQLPLAPRQAAELLRELAQGNRAAPLALIGSSLGGFYATWLAEQCGCRAVLLNPAIRPFEGLVPYLGPQTAFHSAERVELLAEHLEQLRELDTPRISRPERYLLVAATGDEVIDYRTMVAKYAGCASRIIAGSDHALSDFSLYIDAVLDFCGCSGLIPAKAPGPVAGPVPSPAPGAAAAPPGTA